MNLSLLPKVDTVKAQLKNLHPKSDPARLTAVSRQAVSQLRDELQSGSMTERDKAALQEEAARRAWQLYCAPPPALYPRLLNATGVVLHTNLGRAPLAEAAVQALSEAARGYVALELDVQSGKRRERLTPLLPLLCELTGAEAAWVVNNNAAALWLALEALAAGREVLLSRGQLVEIGGGCRVGEIAAASRALIREVGATNRTHPQDYTDAITAQTGAILQVHPANFQQTGYVSTVDTEQLSALAHRHGLPLIVDLGAATFSGAHSPRRFLEQGADLLLFSGDKLLGGPQCGLLLGKKDLIERLRRHPLSRALRVDRLTLAALSATLELYAAGRVQEIPVCAMLNISPDQLHTKARTLAAALTDLPARVSLEAASAPVGGGSCPGEELTGWQVRIEPQQRSATELAARLRGGDPPLLARLHQGALCLDPRTLTEDELPLAAAAVRAALEALETLEAGQ